MRQPGKISGAFLNEATRVLILIVAEHATLQVVVLPDGLLLLRSYEHAEPLEKDPTTSSPIRA